MLLSLGTALKSQNTNGLNDLIDSLERLAQCYKKITIQWVPAHCNIPGNEEANKVEPLNNTI
jgi:ribonuclease HI